MVVIFLQKLDIINTKIYLHLLSIMVKIIDFSNEYVENITR